MPTALRLGLATRFNVACFSCFTAFLLTGIFLLLLDVQGATVTSTVSQVGRESSLERIAPAADHTPNVGQERLAGWFQPL